VIDTKPGNHLAAPILEDSTAVVDHELSWGAALTIVEARLVTAILNSPILGEIVALNQSRGAFGARHFDKYVWYPPIPELDAADLNHLAWRS
jgi:predicted DNA-binding protein (MmcQ/YjbR family)